jgi:membrane-associated protein
MTEGLLELVPEYGAALVLVATFLSCLAIPVPSSLIMLAAGAFVAAGDLSLVSVALAALVGAVLGDQAGYWVGRRGGAAVWARMMRHPKTNKMLGRAQASLHARAGITVYLSRWLFSPLGPYVNLAAGATRLGWPRFTIADLLGEATWVTIYVGMGYLFSARIDEMADLLGSIAGTLAAGTVTFLLGRVLWRARQDVAAQARSAQMAGR